MCDRCGMRERSCWNRFLAEAGGGDPTHRKGRDEWGTQLLFWMMLGRHVAGVVPARCGG